MSARLLADATTTGVGSVHIINPASAMLAQIMYTGTASALTVTIEGSMDGGTTYTTLGSKAFNAGEITAKSAVLSLVGYPVPRVRANVTALTGTPTAINVYLERVN